MFLGIGCSDIIFALTVGDFSYNRDNNTFSPSLWLLMIGIIVTLCAPIYPTYAITKDILQVVIPCAILFPFLAGSSVVSIYILTNLSNTKEDFSKYVMYSFIYNINYIVCGCSLLAFIFFLYFKYNEMIGKNINKNISQN